MKVRKTFIIDDSMEKTWNFLMNVGAISRCLPGCEAIEVENDKTYAVKLRVKVAYIPVKLNVRFHVVDMNPPYSIKTIGRGEDDEKWSSVKIESLFLLKQIGPNRTEISYDADITLQGIWGKVPHRIVKEKTQLGNIFEANVKKVFPSQF